MEAKLVDMAIQRRLLFSLLVLAASYSHRSGATLTEVALLNRSSFPATFVFGVSSAAYQYEGAADKDGRGPSIWDTFTELHPEKITDHSTGDVAVDFYNRYKEDVGLLKVMGLDTFRFSISWSRVLPRGRVNNGINQKGVDFYNNLIGQLLSNGIQPFVTLLHFDVPQFLEDEYGGFLSPNIVNDFQAYADFCFKTFGDRVKHWITINEPHTFTAFGYNSGTAAPGRCSNYVGNCSLGNSASEPYLVAHQLLLSHATAVKQYKEKYQAYQKGVIGIVLDVSWMVPLTQTENDRKAASRELDFTFGWYMNPIAYGEYPESMRVLVGNRLPNFSESQSELLKGSIDFLGVNYYTANYVEDSPVFNTVNLSYSGDSRTILSTAKNGIPIGIPTGVDWLFIYPRGIREVVLYIKEKYKNPPIYITENGIGDFDNGSLPIKDALRDTLRITSYRQHLWYLNKAMKEGANVKGFFSWSFLDDFEWNSGFTYRFGLHYVDFKHGLERYPKKSAIWFKKFLKKEKPIR